MEKINFENFVKGKKKRGWNFRKEYPSFLHNTTEKTEIWISEERLKVPVGKQKVVIKFFLWLFNNKSTNKYTCRLGIVPDYNLLDEKATEILLKLTKNKFFKNPYLHLLDQKDYREIFLYEDDVEEENLNEIRDYMEIAVGIVEKNLIYYLQGGLDRSKEVNKEHSNGWAVLVRARSGSI